MKDIRNKTLGRILVFLLTIATTVSLSGISSYAASSDTTVYITKTGKCYHNSGCSSLSKSCIETTLGAAAGKYTPCSKCKPPTLDSDSTASTTKAATTSKASTSTKETTKSTTKSSTSSTKSSTSSSKSSTSKSNKTTSKASTTKQTSSSSDTTEKMVWVPTNGGTKYHSKSSCRNMKDPVQVSQDEAESIGYTPCKQCHK